MIIYPCFKNTKAVARANVTYLYLSKQGCNQVIDLATQHLQWRIYIYNTNFILINTKTKFTPRVWVYFMCMVRLALYQHFHRIIWWGIVGKILFISCYIAKKLLISCEFSFISWGCTNLYHPHHKLCSQFKKDPPTLINSGF